MKYRQIEIKPTCQNYLKNGIKVITDGHRSYFEAVRTIEGQHIIVKNFREFENLGCFHAENI